MIIELVKLAMIAGKLGIHMDIYNSRKYPPYLYYFYNMVGALHDR